MIAKTIKTVAVATLCAGLGVQSGWTAETGAAEEAAGNAVKTDAQLLKEADAIDLSAQELRPIALENLPAPIDLNTALTPPGSAVSGIARTLHDLDPGEIPGVASTLGGTARSNLPAAASSHSTGARSPSLPSAARGRSRGRGGR